ncbi:MAG: acetylglutamate kinase [Pseudoflavonifractor sp.]|nr:acetylglutamate kinase [Alloprevotella sp.]MCM1117247.1 acetylglutamate kinase [Pseudoflavonifractor sp.]
MADITVVKIGGNVVDNPQALDRFAADFAATPGPKILIHGGGKEATRLSSRLEIPTTMIEGRRVTSAETLEVVTMVYAGLVNKRVVGALRRHGCNAIGLSGIDGGVIPAKKRSATPIDYGFVGDIEVSYINVPLIISLINSGLTPVFCALAYDIDGDTLLNCNADSVASAVAIAVADKASTTLTFCFEKDGVMADLDDPSSLIPSITPATFGPLKESGVIAGGMIPKITNALVATSMGVESVRICRSDLINTSRGTIITND